MRHMGVLAALVLIGPGGVLSGALIERASAEPAPVKQGVTLSLIVSRGHDLVTVLIRNRGSAPACIDPNYAAPARISAVTRNGAPIRSLDTSEGKAAGDCARLAPRRTIHIVYDLRPLYPLGLPGDGRLCYSSWWKQGPPDSRAPAFKISRCFVLPQSGIGRAR